MDGILLVDKQIGLTSHDVVAKVRKILRTEIRNQQLENSKNKKILVPNSHLLVSSSPKVKVGHTGTLDPLASGLLILVVGSYTKRASEFNKMDKTYEVELTLGYSSKTGDSEGPIEKISDKKPSLENIRTVLMSFVGEIQQVPHVHSAVKVGGQRAYKLARAGKKPELKPRQVTVHRLQVTDYGYPKLTFVTDVSSGTYIRSLAEDIGEKLGTGAYVSALRRTKVSGFDIGDAIKMADLSVNKIRKNLQK